VTATPTPAPKATAAPATHGEYLLVLRMVTLTEVTRQPQAWVIRPDGSKARKIAEGGVEGMNSPPIYNLDVVWSHNGSEVHVSKGCDSHLSDVAVGGWGETPIAGMTDKTQDFAWSEDEGDVAYFRYTGEAFICMQGTLPTTHDLMIMKADGSARTVVLRDTPWYPTSWLAGRRILVRDHAGSETTWALVGFPGGAVTPLGIDGDTAKVSPDGTLVAFLQVGNLKVRAVSGGPVSSLGTANSFAWSPDGTMIAAAGSTLRIVTVATGASRTMSTRPAARPAWAPDGKSLAFEMGTGDVYVMNVKAASPTLVVSGWGTILDLQWQP